MIPKDAEDFNIITVDVIENLWEGEEQVMNVVRADNACNQDEPSNDKLEKY